MPASPFASRGSGRPIQMDWTDHSADGNPTGAPGPHATAARPLIEATRPIDEGDDGFRSGGPANSARFRRLDTASAPSAPQSRLATRPLAARRSLDTISISLAIRVEAARWRKEKGWLPSLGHASRGTFAISGSRPYANHTDRFYRESAALLRSARGTIRTNGFLITSVCLVQDAFVTAMITRLGHRGGRAGVGIRRTISVFPQSTSWFSVCHSPPTIQPSRSSPPS